MFQTAEAMPIAQPRFGARLPGVKLLGLLALGLSMTFPSVSPAQQPRKPADPINTVQRQSKPLAFPKTLQRVIAKVQSGSQQEAQGNLTYGNASLVTVEFEPDGRVRFRNTENQFGFVLDAQGVVQEVLLGAEHLTDPKDVSCYRGTIRETLHCFIAEGKPKGFREIDGAYQAILQEVNTLEQFLLQKDKEAEDTSGITNTATSTRMEVAEHFIQLRETLENCYYPKGRQYAPPSEADCNSAARMLEESLNKIPYAMNGIRSYRNFGDSESNAKVEAFNTAIKQQLERIRQAIREAYIAKPGVQEQQNRDSKVKDLEQKAQGSVNKYEQQLAREAEEREQELEKVEAEEYEQ